MYKTIEIFLQGARHKSNCAPCEDRTYSLSKNGVDVIALADGAGSKEYTYAAEGAECVTKTICAFLCEKFDEVYDIKIQSSLNQLIMTVCQDALRKRAEELGVDNIIALSSTLLCIAVNGDRVISCHIGDGAIGCLTKNEIRVVSGPENGEFASTTYFITLPQADEYLHIDKFEKSPDDAVYFLMSDGTTEYAFDEYNYKFFDGAGKLALLVYDKNGQKKLKEIIQKILIDSDKFSDDCSFIALRVNNKKPNLLNSKLNSYSVKKKNSSSLNPKSSGDIDMTDEYVQKIKDENKFLANKNKTLKIATLVLSILVILFAIGFALQTFSLLKAHNKKETVITTTEHITNHSTAESSITATTDPALTNAEVSEKTKENITDIKKDEKSSVIASISKTTTSKKDLTDSTSKGANK